MIQFPYDTNLRYLPLVYLLPPDLIARCPTLCALPRCLSEIAASNDMMNMIAGDAFLKEIMDAAASLAFPHFGFGGWKEHYTGYSPVWRLSYSLPIWAKLIEEETGWGVQALFRMKPGTQIPFFDPDYIRKVFERVVKRAIEEQGWQPILDVVREMPCDEDFEPWQTNVRIDFQRKWYHTRSKNVQTVSLEALMEDEEDGSIFYIPDATQNVEAYVIAKDFVERFLAALSDKDRQIVELRQDGYSYAKQNGFTNLKWYTDDGWSGTDFQRPGFQAMLADIEAGKVGCVIVKDMSRLGRNYLQVGMYTEMLFPQKGVRFIAVNDGVDSAQGENDFTALRNLFNEWTVKDTSKKIRAVKKAKGMSGKPLTSRPPYGYLMGEDGHFIIDEEAAPVVRQIYQLCLAGNGPTKIARMLAEQQIPTPGTLDYRRTGNTRRYYPDYPCKWATNTVVHILEYREYTGCTVNFKTTMQSYKVHKIIYNPEEEYAIFEDTHEPIIDKETWERVQELRKQRKRPNRYDEMGLFSGILFCADCGSVLYQQRYQTDKRKQDCYICGSYKKRTRDCTAHFIRTDLLTAGVLDNLRKVTEYAAKHESRFVKLLIQQNEDGGKKRSAARRKELDAAEKRIAELSNIFKRLYEDNISGKISDERFMELSADYEQEQAELKDRAAVLQAELDKAQEATVNAEKFMKIVRKHLAFEELTPTLLRELVEKIIVHECEYDENGSRRQSIDIYYSFVGKIDLPQA